MFIGPWALKSFKSIENMPPRMMLANFNGNPSATIISYYNPTNASDETDLNAFYNELSSLPWYSETQHSNHRWRHEYTNR